MIRIRSVFHYTSRCYGICLFIIFIGCPWIYFICSNRLLESPLNVIDIDINNLGLFDDDDNPLICPREIQFDIKNCHHLAIILASELLPFVWKNFRALLCIGVDAYVMLDRVFLINSPSRGDNFKPHTNRSIRSYSHRFLYVNNQQLAKFGVSYMKKLPSIEYTSWDRAVVWLYQRQNWTNAWVIEHDVQWFDVRNMTYLFDRFTNDTTDLLCDNIVPTNGRWSQWPRSQSDIFPKASWLGTFSPLVRWSRRLLKHHYRYMQLIHRDRLKYEIDRNYRFQEFVMGTIAKTENLSIALYNTNHDFIHIVLGNMDDKRILSHLRNGKYILHPVKQDSILTDYPTKDLAKMIQNTRLNLDNMTLLKKEIVKQ